MGQKVEKSSLEPKKSLLICCRGHWYGSIEPSLSQDFQGSVFFNIALKSGAKSSVANMGHKGEFSRRCPTSYVWPRYSFGTFLWSLWIIPTKIARCEGLSKNGLFVPSPSYGILSRHLSRMVKFVDFCNKMSNFRRFFAFPSMCSLKVMTWQHCAKILPNPRNPS